MGSQKQVRHRIVSKLHEIVRPFLLRRVKADVDVSLPAKVEVRPLDARAGSHALTSVMLNAGGRLCWDESAPAAALRRCDERQHSRHTTRHELGHPW